MKDELGKDIKTELVRSATKVYSYRKHNDCETKKKRTQKMCNIKK